MQKTRQQLTASERLVDNVKREGDLSDYHKTVSATMNVAPFFFLRFSSSSAWLFKTSAKSPSSSLSWKVEGLDGFAAGGA